MIALSSILLGHKTMDLVTGNQRPRYSLELKIYWDMQVLGKLLELADDLFRIRYALFDPLALGFKLYLTWNVDPILPSGKLRAFHHTN